MIKCLVCVCSHEMDETLLKNDDSIGEEDFDHSLSHFKKVLPSLPGASLHNVTLFPFVSFTWADLFRLRREPRVTAI